MHVAALGFDLRLEHLEIEVEMLERVVLDLKAAIPERFELGQRRRRPGAVRLPAGLDLAEGVLKRRLASASSAFRSKARDVGCMKPSSAASAAARLGDAGDATAEACVEAREDLGDVVGPDRRALALEPARHVQKAAEIAGGERAGPGGGDVGRLVLHHPRRDGGYLTQQNVPPKPQQVSGSRISMRSTPGMESSRRRGCALTPSSRRPEQLS
jgi:hypothetical protein